MQIVCSKTSGVTQKSVQCNIMRLYNVRIGAITLPVPKS